jgi:NAD(P)-dependent dehydrogenase (short-subunit alcohol dehydrogenase family)
LNQVALITGASRGIGRACAVSLAEHGFDCVIAARTVNGTEVNEYTRAGTVQIRTMPGSLQETAALIEERGRRTAVVPLDLTDRASVEEAARSALSAFGRIDVLVNNAIYQGPGIHDPALEITPDNLETVYRANVVHQLLLIQRFLPDMIARRSGSIINMVSGAGTVDPFVRASDGGWGFGYGSSKAALIRLAGFLDIENPDCGVNFYTVDPGLILTDLMREMGLTDEYIRNFGGAPVEVAGEVIAYLATSPDARVWHKKLLFAQPLCKKLELVPGWPEPVEASSAQAAT